MQTAPNKQGSLKPRVQFPLDSIHILTPIKPKVQWVEFFFLLGLDESKFLSYAKNRQAQGE